MSNSNFETDWFLKLKNNGMLLKDYPFMGKINPLEINICMTAIQNNGRSIEYVPKYLVDYINHQIKILNWLHIVNCEPERILTAPKIYRNNVLIASRACKLNPELKEQLFAKYYIEEEEIEEVCNKKINPIHLSQEPEFIVIGTPDDPYFKIILKPLVETENEPNEILETEDEPNEIPKTKDKPKIEIVKINPVKILTETKPVPNKLEIHIPEIKVSPTPSQSSHSSPKSSFSPNKSYSRKISGLNKNNDYEKI
jgi:hypothetical protein